MTVRVTPASSRSREARPGSGQSVRAATRAAVERREASVPPPNPPPQAQEEGGYGRAAASADAVRGRRACRRSASLLGEDFRNGLAKLGRAGVARAARICVMDATEPTCLL